MMNFKEFSNQVKNVHHLSKSEINNSYGIRDSFKTFNKYKPKSKLYMISREMYINIVKRILLLLTEEFINGEDIVLPYNMGKLEIRKVNKTIKIKDGKIVTNLPIDWSATLKLWYEDEEAKSNKVLIRKEWNEIYKTYYNKLFCDYKNKSFYKISINRDVRKRISLKINDDLLNVFNLI